jgi:vanillate O-demethylase ferredoxin subunit
LIALKVTRIDDLTPRIKRIEFAAANGGPVPGFTAGAHIDLELGNGEARSYSLLNDQGETHRYAIGVLRETNSKGASIWIHDALKVGDVLQSSEPSNQFALSEAGEHSLFIAGGIGVTPIMPMAARVAELGKSYVLHYCARTRADAACVDDLERRHGARLKLTFDNGDPAKGLDVAALVAKRPAAAHVYVCGPAGLIRDVREASRDWPKGTVHYELFKGSEEDVAIRKDDREFNVVLKRAGRTLYGPADKTILDVLKAEGFKIKTLCREGVCGTCTVKLLSGKADHRDDYLSDDERETAIQVCVSRAMPGETLVLDL